MLITKKFLKNLKYIKFDKNYKVLINFCKDHENDDIAEIVNNKWRSLIFIRTYAFVYFITKDKHYLKTVKKLIHVLINTGLPTDDQFVRSKLEAAALIYDWCYDGLSEKEKKELILFIEKAIRWLENKKYLTINGVTGGHHYHAHKSALMGALAIYYKSKYAQYIVQKVMKNLTNYYWPFYKFLSADDGSFHMWWEYTKYYLWNTCEIFDIWRSATGEDLFQSNKWLNKVALFLIYGINDDYKVFMTGDNHCPKLGNFDRLLFLKIAKEYNNPYAKWIAERLEKRIGHYRPMCVYDLLWKTSLVSKPINSLPTSKLFKKAGVVIMKECWGLDGIKPCMNVLFKCTPYYFENHSHRDSNSFEIYYRGYLAIDSGYYYRYGSSHWLNYYIRTIAHNTLIIYDPKETFKFHNKPLVNDGGQKFIFPPPRTLDSILTGKYSIGDILRYENTFQYTYALGDASKAYNKNKLEVFHRHFLFFKNANVYDHPFIIIFDYVRKKHPNFPVKYLLHSIKEPQIKGNKISIENKEAILYDFLIYPKDYILEKIGGPGREFEVNGKNYPPLVKTPLYSGKWRVEIQSRYRNKEEHFLNILFVKDKDIYYQNRIVSMQAVVPKDLAMGLGCILNDKLFFFSKNPQNKIITYSVPKAGIIHHFVFNLSSSSKYEILFNSQKIYSGSTTNQGTLMFKTEEKGIVTIVKL